MCVHNLDYRGTQRCAKECAVVYRRAGHDVKVFACQKGGEIEAELDAEKIASGLATGRKILVRFPEY